MIINTAEQRSKDWFNAREKIATASQFSRIITSNGSVSSQFNAYVDEVKGVAAKREITTESMQNGIIYEPLALLEVEDKYDIEIEQIGFITPDNKSCGCSPDGVVNDVLSGIVAGVEVKTVLTTVFDRYVRLKQIPPQYYAQVMGSMAICEVEYWYFGAYDYVNDRLFSLKVNRDDVWIKRFWQLIEVFNNKLKG